MRYKVKWRAEGEEPLQPEAYDSEDAAKARRGNCSPNTESVTIDIWNDDETGGSLPLPESKNGAKYQIRAPASEAASRVISCESSITCPRR